MSNGHGLQNGQQATFDGPERSRSRNETLRLLTEILGDMMMQREARQNNKSSVGDYSAEKDNTIRSEGKSVRFNIPTIPENQEPRRPDHTKSAGDTNSSKVDEYVAFARKCDELYTMLIRLEYAFRSVGSGGPAMEACRDVRKAMEAIAEMLGRNTMDLYQAVSLNQQVLMTRGPDIPAYPRGVPVAFRNLRMALKKLDASFIDFVDMYFDGKLLSSIDRARYQLSSIVKTLQETHHWKGDLYDPIGFQPSLDAQLYVNALITWLSAFQDEVLPALMTFLETGIPMITTAQQYQTSKYLNMTTIAAFFSGVTATTLQFTYQSSSTVVENAVNAFLFSSLVFSIASAVNSLLAMSWRASFIRAPDGHLNSIARIWLIKGPMISLIFSGAFYSMGLVLFAFSSKQNIVTEVITTFFSVAHALGLLCLSMVFVYEQWKFQKNAGALGEHLTKRSLSMSIANGLWRLCSYIAKLVSNGDRDTPPSSIPLIPMPPPEPRQMRQKPLRSYTDAHLQSGRPTVEGSESRFSSGFGSLGPQGPISYTRFGGNVQNNNFRPLTDESEQFPLLLQASPKRDTVLASSAPSPPYANVPPSPTLTPVYDAQPDLESRVQPALSREKELSSLSYYQSHPVTPIFPLIGSRSPLSIATTTRPVPPPYTVIQSTAPQAMTPRLHQPNMEFSPDGKFLTWCRRGKFPYLLDVSNENAVSKMQLPVLSSIAQSVAWSPDGSMIAFALRYEVLFWDSSDTNRRNRFSVHLYRSHEIKSLKWLPNSEGFLILESSGLTQYQFITRDRLRLHKNYMYGREEIVDFAISSNSEYLVCLTSTSASSLQGETSNSKAILVFGLNNNEEKFSIIVPRSAYSITASKKHPSFVLSFFGTGDNVVSPPVLYELKRMEISSASDTLQEIQLVETQVYMAPDGNVTPFRGHACFAGTDEEYVISSTICGQILVWGRKNATIKYASQSRMPFILEPFIGHNCGSNWLGPKVMYVCRDDELEPSLWVEDATGNHLVMKASSCESGDTEQESQDSAGGST